MLWETKEQEKELFKQRDKMFNLQVAKNEMEEEEDEKHKRRDDEARSQRASHSPRVIEAVAQICRPSRSANIDRSRQRRGKDLLDDYFARNNAFPHTYFRRHFRLERHLFNKIMMLFATMILTLFQNNDDFGVTSLLLEQKIIVAMRMFAYGAYADQVDEIARIRVEFGWQTVPNSLCHLPATYT